MYVCMHACRRPQRTHMTVKILMSGWEGIQEYISLSQIDSILKDREKLESEFARHDDKCNDNHGTTLSDIRTVKLIGSSLNDNFICKIKTCVVSVLSFHTTSVS